MSAERQVYNLKVDASGRIVLPSRTRERLHIAGGDTVIIVEDETGVHLKTRDQLLAEYRHTLPSTFRAVSFCLMKSMPTAAPSSSVTRSVVLDASAVIAALNVEPGADVVLGAMAGALISAVNYSEVLKKAIERCQTTGPIGELLGSYHVEIIPFDKEHAAASAELYSEGKPHGMSFADRACLALGVQRKLMVLTAESKMRLLTLPIKVKLIRNAH